MTSKEITALAFRIFAIYLGANLLISVWPMTAVLVSSARLEASGFPVRNFLVALCLMLGLGGLIVVLLVRISGSVLKNLPNGVSTMPVGITPIFIVQLLGLAFIIKGACVTSAHLAPNDLIH